MTLSRSNSFDLKREDQEYLHFLQCKGNLKRFLPNLKIEPKDFYKKVKFCQTLASKQEEDFSILKKLNVINPPSFDKHVPKIFCTFHLGSYRLINHYLVENKYNYTLVISSKTLQNSAQRFETHFRQLSDNEQQFKILDAEQANIGIQMIREIRSGRSLLLYMDGNTGVGGFAQNNENTVSVNFFGQSIQSRKGIPFISHVTKTAIIPVISYWEEYTQPSLHFFDSIDPNLSNDKESYAQTTSQILYDLMINILKKYPIQWEGWFYVNNFLSQGHSQTNLSSKEINFSRSYYHFNTNKYDYLKSNGRALLFDIDQYLCLNISDDFYRLLNYVKNDDVPIEELKKVFNANTLKNLLTLQVFI